jgi:hypothetical protein
VKNWQKIVFVCIILILVGLVIFRPELVMVYVVQPLARVLWLIYRMVLMIDQVVYWGLLAVGALILFLRMIPGRQKGLKRAEYQEMILKENRHEYWSDLIRRAPGNLAASSLLRNNMERLIGETNDFLDEENELNFDISMQRKNAWMRKLPWGLNIIFHKIQAANESKVDQQLKADLNRVLSQLESKLEIPNEE